MSDPDKLQRLIDGARQRVSDQEATRRQPLLKAFRALLTQSLSQEVRDALGLSYQWDERNGPVAVFSLDGKQWRIRSVQKGFGAPLHDVAPWWSWVVQVEDKEVLEARSGGQLEQELLIAIGEARQH